MSEVNRIDIPKLKEYIRNSHPDTKFYFGADSERVKINGIPYADYTIVVVAHLEGRHGGHLFAEIVRERVYDPKASKPAMRLMQEVYKVAELFLAVKDELQDRDYDIHLDIASDPRYGSNCVAKEAIAYVRGMCGIVPKIKPNAWAASFGADRAKDLGYVRLVDSGAEIGTRKVA